MPENKDKIDLDDWDLSRAAAENRVDIVRLLIEQGANTDGIDLSWMDDVEKSS